jgi:beta-galactosidase/beta-glucuronidase
VNDVPVGEHEGGFLPFSFDVTEHLVEGRNTIKVRAESPTDNPLAYPEAPLAEIPFGKQSWYGPLSGIWQPVHLEWRHVDHIERARLLPTRPQATSRRSCSSTNRSRRTRTCRSSRSIPPATLVRA